MLLHDIAEYAVRERESGPPSEVVHHAKRVVIDWFAATLAGGGEPPATLLCKALSGDIGRGRAILYPSGETASLRTAALVNGTASHIVEFDDIFRDGIYHPGSPVVAAALAASQSRQVTGEAFLRAVVVGYEISTRIAAAVNPAHYRFWHTTGTVGTLGAAAAAATVVEADADQMAHAIATSATFAAGLQQAFRSDAMSKPLHAGHAAEAGALAALAAAEGVTGALDILEGESGFAKAMSDDCDWSAVLAGLGEDYNITKMTVKNHGCCGHTFAAIDGLLELRKTHGINAQDVERINVHTYKTALDVTGSWEARTPVQARFSLPYVVATALVYGSVRLSAFSQERLHDPAVVDLMNRVELDVDPEIDARFPKQRGAKVAVTTTNGQVLEFFQPTRKGDPDQPLNDRELEEKFLELAVPVIGEADARGLLAELWSLDVLESTDLRPGGVVSARS
jgi:2-methylcitrate dehydratase PrpD